MSNPYTSDICKVVTDLEDIFQRYIIVAQNLEGALSKKTPSIDLSETNRIISEIEEYVRNLCANTTYLDPTMLNPVIAGAKEKLSAIRLLRRRIEESLDGCREETRKTIKYMTEPYSEDKRY